MFSFQTRDIVVLDNKKNRNCGSGAIVVFPKEETLLLIGFNQSELPFDYDRSMTDLAKSLRLAHIVDTKRLNLNYIAPPPPLVRMNDFMQTKGVWIGSQLYPYN